MGHTHAAAMAEYAKDAAETDMPWERWEVSMTESGDEYRNLLGHPDWADTLHAASTELRRQHSRIEELEAQLSAIGAGGVEPLRKKAVPVQMPEPDAWRYTTVRGHFRYRGRRVGFATEYPMLKPEPLYTEQQVRAMLSTGVQAQAVPIGWREQFATEVYADLEAAD